MKYMIKLYQICKPICIYTSYLFTSLTIFYLAINELSGKKLPLTHGFLWGLFAFSLGSIVLQRLFLGTELLCKMPYLVRLVLYACGTVLWGCLCLNIVFALYESENTAKVMLLPALLLGMLCCVGFEFFNRYRMHMYNTLLEQYKRRKKP